MSEIGRVRKSESGPKEVIIRLYRAPIHDYVHTERPRHPLPDILELIRYIRQIHIVESYMYMCIIYI